MKNPLLIYFLEHNNHTPIDDIFEKIFIGFLSGDSTFQPFIEEKYYLGVMHYFNNKKQAIPEHLYNLMYFDSLQIEKISDETVIFSLPHLDNFLSTALIKKINFFDNEKLQHNIAQWVTQNPDSVFSCEYVKRLAMAKFTVVMEYPNLFLTYANIPRTSDIPKAFTLCKNATIPEETLNIILSKPHVFDTINIDILNQIIEKENTLTWALFTFLYKLDTHKNQQFLLKKFNADMEKILHIQNALSLSPLEAFYTVFPEQCNHANDYEILI